MRALHLAFLAAAVVCTASLATPPVRATTGFAAASNVRIKEIKVLGSPPNELFTVKVIWDGPPRPDCPGLSVGAFIEVRDVDNGTPFGIRQSHSDFNNEIFGAGYEGGFMADGTSSTSFLREGGTYEFRISYHWQSYGVPPQANPVIDEYTITAPVRFIVTRGGGPGPDPDAVPTDVLAVLHPKKNQVKVVWDWEGEAPQQFAVERRRIAGPAAKETRAGAKETKAGDTTEFEEIIRVRGTVRALFDKRVHGEAEYEYRVAAIIANTKRLGGTDRTYPKGKCPASSFQLWKGRWRRLGFETGLEFVEGGGGLVDANVVLVPGIESSESFVWDSARIPLASSSGGNNHEGQPSLSYRVKGVGEGLVGLEAGDKGKLTVKLLADDAFAPEAYLAARALLRVGKATLIDGDFVPFIARVQGPGGDPDPLRTTICGSLSASLSKGKSETTAVGQTVTFAFAAVSLGPQPLLSKKLRLDVTLEGGTFLETGGTTTGKKELVRRIGDPTGTSAASFEVGALGPLTYSKSEQAIVIMRAKVEPVHQGQLRCSVKLVETPDPDQGRAFTQTLTFPSAEFVSEVLIAAPKVSK